MTIVYAVGLMVLLAFVEGMEESEVFGFVVPYEQYISVGLVVLMGHLAVQAGAKFVFASAQRQTTTDVAGTLRIMTRLLGYGLIFSFLVSVLTDNPAAALTMGSFAGLVAGFASQNVLDNTVAGIFLTLARPIRIWRQSKHRQQLRDGCRHLPDALRAGTRRPAHFHTILYGC